jgi:type IV pilus assembly protein PilC
MALISSASSGQSQPTRLDPGAQKKGVNVKAAQALAKQKSLEKKAKTYKLPMGELALFTQQIASSPMGSL